ncbi:MAG TPA: response regulator transcription factor, partial [Candidatus Polarisedimenticolia bacterium]|nr:response regulator transcription factor [Candidatus Polarisedimenticolia bacterium]
MNTTTPITIVLGDDHKIVLKGLRALLEMQPGFEVVGDANDGLKLTALVEKLKPDVLVVDLMMPGLNGFDITRRVLKRQPKTKVVILSMYSSEPHVVEALQSGATAYVVKDASTEELVTAIRDAMAGRRYLSAPFSNELIETYLKRPGGIDPYD